MLGRMMATTALGCVVGLASSGEVFATTILVDDFNDGNDDGWTRYDSTTTDPWGPDGIGVITWHWPLAQAPPGIVDVTFDDIYFTPIPEPTCFVLAALGVIALAACGRQRKKRVR